MLAQDSRSVTADMALRLGEYFGTSPEFWLNLPGAFDLRKMRASEWPEIRRRIRARNAA